MKQVLLNNEEIKTEISKVIQNLSKRRLTSKEKMKLIDSMIKFYRIDLFKY